MVTPAGFKEACVVHGGLVVSTHTDMTDVRDGYVEPALWGRDHWSTLAYLESVSVECAGFQVGADARMRSNCRHFRVMAEECPRPRRPGRPVMGVVMGREHGSRLRNGSVMAGHDDWCCIQDMAHAGLLTVGVEGVEPRETLHLSPLGLEWAADLRAHKTAGGQFGNFEAGCKKISMAQDVSDIPSQASGSMP